MSAIYEELDEKLIDFIRRQKMFFVASAPLSAEGHVNVSPKGYDCFRIVNPRQVAYLDLGGSGIETVAHARENGRITIMFCAFEGPAVILRLYGRATIMQFDHPSFSQELAKFRFSATLPISRFGPGSFCRICAPPALGSPILRPYFPPPEPDGNLSIDMATMRMIPVASN